MSGTKDTELLISRIDQEVRAEVKRQKEDWAQMMAANHDRDSRLRRYEPEAQHLIELVKPRVEAFVERFKAVIKVEPTIRQHTRGVTLTFAATVARASLRFEVFPDQTVDHVRLECIQEIVPVVVRVDKQSVLEYPLGSVNENEVIQWFDDRIIAFVKAYLAVLRQDVALREQLKDLLVEDPVTKIRFPKHLASTHLERDGHSYYFVDEDTRREFEQQAATTDRGQNSPTVASKA
jgi:YHS domain-containing protein